jgi:hypothetical protein
MNLLTVTVKWMLLVILCENESAKKKNQAVAASERREKKKWKKTRTAMNSEKYVTQTTIRCLR